MNCPAAAAPPERRHAALPRLAKIGGFGKGQRTLGHADPPAQIDAGGEAQKRVGLAPPVPILDLRQSRRENRKPESKAGYLKGD
jgi:hypothetical protein